MDYETVCPNCQETFPVRRRHFGNTVKCPQCEGDVFLDPDDLPEEVSVESKTAARENTAAKSPLQKGLKRRPSEHGRIRRKPKSEQQEAISDTTGTQPPGGRLTPVSARRRNSTLMLIGFACFGLFIVGACAAGGLYVAYHVKDKNLREYAGERIYGEEYKDGNDRLLASILAHKYHDQALNDASGSGEDGGWRALPLFADEKAYYVALKKLVDQTLGEMNAKVEVLDENMVGSWQRFEGDASSTLDLKEDGNFVKVDGVGDSESAPDQVTGEWKIKGGQFARRVNAKITKVEIVKLSTDYLVLRNRSGVLEIYRKGDMTKPAPEAVAGAANPPGNQSKSR